MNRLIFVGADVRAKDNEERIALHLAAEYEMFSRVLTFKKKLLKNYYFKRSQSIAPGVNQ